MLLEVTGLREMSVAHVALEPFLPTVRPFVLAKAGLMCKVLAACFALERSLPSVYLHVVRVMTGRSKWFPAQLTFIRSFASALSGNEEFQRNVLIALPEYSLCAHMNYEVVVVLKWFATNGALKMSLACMDEFMLLQTRQMRESLTTILTSVWFLASMTENSRIQKFLLELCRFWIETLTFAYVSLCRTIEQSTCRKDRKHAVSHLHVFAGVSASGKRISSFGGTIVGCDNYL